MSYYLYDGQFYRFDELYHWGIKGMRWGVRRYQNKDGTLTPAGKKKYQNKDGSLTEEGKQYIRDYGGTVDFPIRMVDKIKVNSENRRNLSTKKIDEDIDALFKEARESLMSKTDKLKAAGYIFDKNTQDSEWQKHGAGSLEEHNSDLVATLLREEPAYNKAITLQGERYTEKWREATLKDLNFDITDKTMEFMREQFKVPSYRKGLDKDGMDKHESLRLRDRAYSITKQIRDNVVNKTYESVDARNKAIDNAFRRAIRDAEKLRDSRAANLISDELQQQWAFVYDELDSD